MRCNAPWSSAARSSPSISSSSRTAASSSQRALSSSLIDNSVCARPQAAPSVWAPNARRSQSCSRMACCTASRRAAWLRTGLGSASRSGGRSSSQWPSVSTRGSSRGVPAARAAASSASRTPGICAAVGTTTCAPAAAGPQWSRKYHVAVAACSRKAGPGENESRVMDGAPGHVGSGANGSTGPWRARAARRGQSGKYDGVGRGHPAARAGAAQ
ncbi:hypothetical protein D3C87_1158750 [compost metagenome]